MGNLSVTLGGYGIAVLLFFLLLNAREDLGEAVESCNTDKMAAVAEAERRVREATNSALRRRIDDLEAAALRESEARRIAEVARTVAESDAHDSQETIRRLLREAENEDAPAGVACLRESVPGDILDELR